MGGTAGTGGSGAGGAGGAGNPSCAGLAKTCGPNGDQDCCASSLVPGGTFYRSYDGVTSGYTSTAYPATVSDFRLDTYEITVGRFRKFVAAYTQTMTAQGAGKNPNNTSDPGWDATDWNAGLETNAATLKTALKCNSTYHTWTDAAGTAAAESLPINCIDWFEAEAFCIWDGGRLPTEAEWNYAASGGTQQRVYPWSTPATSVAIDASYVVDNLSSLAIAGSKSPKGDGRWGQADLAGNVWEWVQDWYVSPYTNSCTNCSYLTSTPYRVIRGGGVNSAASNLLASYRYINIPSYVDYDHGARCAR